MGTRRHTPTLLDVETVTGFRHVGVQVNIGEEKAPKRQRTGGAPTDQIRPCLFFWQKKGLSVRCLCHSLQTTDLPDISGVCVWCLGTIVRNARARWPENSLY